MKEINIAKIIVMKRKEKRITQDALADYIGVTKASVSKWETGQSYPDITILPKLATYFNITIDELLGYLPQLDKEEIGRIYHKLADDFGEKPFDEVMVKVDAIIEKYYSCFPLLIQMALLLLNHHMLATSEEKKKEVLEKIITLCRRVKAEGDDVWLAGQANSFEAMTQMVLGDSIEVLDLLEGTIKPVVGDEVILAGAYQSIGELDKAKSVLQISMYQHVLSFISTGASYLMLEAADEETFSRGLERLLPVAESMKLIELNPNVMAQVYYTAANGLAMHGKYDRSLVMLKAYVRACKKLIYPFELHGDEFFDRIGEWFKELDLGSGPPRSEKVVKEGMLQAVTMNPVFTPLYNEVGYKNIISELNEFIGGN